MPRPWSPFIRRPDGHAVYDFAAAGVEALFDIFRRGKPCGRRDLAPEVADHLADCARGGRDAARAARTLHAAAAPGARVQRAISSFFDQLATIERAAMATMARTSLVLFLPGLAPPFVAAWPQQWRGGGRPGAGDVFGGGGVSVEQRSGGPWCGLAAVATLREH